MQRQRHRPSSGMAVAHVDPPRPSSCRRWPARARRSREARTVGGAFLPAAASGGLRHLLKRDKRSAHAKAARWLAQHAESRAQGLLATAAEHYAKAATSQMPRSSMPAAAYQRARSPTSRHSTARRAAGGVPGRRRAALAPAGHARTGAGHARPARRPRRTSKDCWRWPRPCRRVRRTRRAEAAWRRCDIADRRANG